MNGERESLQRSEGLAHHGLKQTTAHFRRFSHLLWIAIMIVILTIPNSSIAGQINQNDRAYWQNFVKNLDEILAHEQSDVRPVRAFTDTIYGDRSNLSSDKILKSSIFFVNNFFSGRYEQYTYANDKMIVGVVFDRKTGFYLPSRSGPRLKKTIDDYNIHEINKK